MKSKCRGFSLIELMIAIAIVAILSAVAFPGYNEYVRRSTLQEAFSEMANMRVRLEQFYQSNRGYGDPGQTTPCGHDGTANRVSFTPDNARFTYTCALSNGNQGYLITATGSTGRAVGHTFTLDHANAKATTQFKGSASTKTCWTVKGDEC